jgi:hypothetical protein
MKRSFNIKLLLPILVLCLWQCKEKYVSPYNSPATGYLVVEGYITGNGPTQFALSRTVPLSGSSTVPPETNAKVQVEGSDNSTYPLTEQGSGLYVIDTMALNPATKYRLRITTKDGKAYLSDFVTYKKTPAIDSINFIRNSNGVNLYANTHDPAGATHYYQWQYNETWEYTSSEPSEYIYVPDDTAVVFRPDSEQIFFCWKNTASSQFILGSSAKLAQDVIYEQLLDQIPQNSQQFQVLFSILVRQYALTEDGYNFLTLMQKNTESLGSIFDAQPSALKGNIHSLSDPNEQVVGFVSAGTMEQKRVFISSDQVKPWQYYVACSSPDRVVGIEKDTLYAFFGVGGYTPIQPHYPRGSPFPDGYYANATSCVDCRLQGGTNVKPSYWP